MSSSRLVDAHTEVRTKRITYNWSIKRFDLLPEDEEICSPWFSSTDNCDKWRLELYPRGRTDNSLEDIDCVALYVVRSSPGKSLITVYIELKMSKSNMTILRNLSFTHKYEAQQYWGFPRFVEKSELLTKKSSDNDQFTISCVIDVPVGIITSSFDAAIFDLKNSQLSDDFRLLFEDPVFSDFTIIVGNQKFPTHRNILAKRSPVFAAMFEHEDLEENRRKGAKIENIEPNVIKGMLEFIYTDQVTDIKELASGLLEVADKCDLKKLRIMCERTLCEGINKENAAEILLLADLHRADTLKKCAMKYIVDHAPEMIKSNNLKKMGKNPELLLELFQQSVLPQEAIKKLKVPKHKSKV